MKNPLMSFGYFKHHTVQHNGQFSALRIGFITKSIVAALYLKDSNISTNERLISILLTTTFNSFYKD